ncbi:hypothetical protein P152DRAFT_454523 [Eremomyces bilateralis CBS 781.70]|uniref:GPI anchored protein n=1 Tax=Eremomyces bilateralis CBS 781.70 TaxID=1392243 RepID=A0A6G1GE19_9PEZI|nr:uncharacterized protein P152DRAFT_454523 [Eremomyces bilateralis CBS 781.70]KAF1816264.1 hypothetical protein P152DRAFT_454523 [Eremomyces bilateralis CBS 781.70]
MVPAYLLFLANLLLPVYVSATCSISSATPVDISDTSSNSGGSGSVCDSNDICDGLINHGLFNAGGYIKRSAIDIPKRDTPLVCDGGQTCIQFYSSASGSSSDQLIICIDLNTGDFLDEAGERGNLLTGVYTNTDGQVVTLGVSATEGTATTTARVSKGTSAGSGTAAATGAGGQGVQSTPGIGANVAVKGLVKSLGGICGLLLGAWIW